MKRLIAFVLFVLAYAAICTAAEPFYLKNGDRVVFYGDSITDQRLYTVFTEAYVLTRFPKLDVTFVHSGWGGDRVTGGGGGAIDLRLKRDVFAYKPTVMTIMLGMNDGSYRAFDQGIFDTYANGYKHIVESVKRTLPGIRITAIQPSPFDDVTRPPTFEPGYNTVLVRYGQFVTELAKSERLDVADLNSPVVAALEKANAADAALAQKIVPDRVHPGPGGHLLMAEALLKAWNAPAVVSEVSIDAAAPKVENTVQTAVTGLKAAGGTISWTQKDAALPVPIDLKDAAMGLAIKASDFMEAMDRQTLKVAGLSADRYALKIDGERVAGFTRQELSDGVNLAGITTPMLSQAAAVLNLTRKHNDIHFARWRMVEVPLADLDLAGTLPAIKALDKLDADLVVKQRAAAQPRPHAFELAPEP